MTATNSPAPAARKPKVSPIKYERYGSIVAIAPKAYFETYYLYDEPARENIEAGEAVIVDIRDPLETHAHYCYDSYEDITRRIAAACQTSARGVILRFDSPGGEAAGCFEAARNARALCDAAGKTLHAFVEGDCCSAAYAYASVCHTVTIGDTALCGSIGVIMCRPDYSAANAQAGMRFEFIKSGAHKSDGHPDMPITDAELASLQTVIDAMGRVFFDHVAATRGMAADAVAQLEAKVFDGQAAVAAGLADQVGTLQTVLALVATGQKGPIVMAATYEKAREALAEVAKGDDANAKAAQAALAAMDAAAGGGAGDDEETPPADPDKKDDAPGTAGDTPPAGDPKKDDDDGKAAASAYRAAIKAQREAAEAKAELKAMREDSERARLIASRPGMAPEMVAILQKAPIELVRETIKDMPESPVNPQLARPPVQGASQGTGLSPDAKADLDRRMGLLPSERTNQQTETKLVLSARRPAAKPPVNTPPAPGSN